MPTLPVLVLLIFWLASGVVHCAFAATVASNRITTLLKSLAIELGRCRGWVVIIVFSLSTELKNRWAASVHTCASGTLEPIIRSDLLSPTSEWGYSPQDKLLGDSQRIREVLG